MTRNRVRNRKGRVTSDPLTGSELALSPFVSLRVNSAIEAGSTATPLTSLQLKGAIALLQQEAGRFGSRQCDGPVTSMPPPGMPSAPGPPRTAPMPITPPRLPEKKWRTDVSPPHHVSRRPPWHAAGPFGQWAGRTEPRRSPYCFPRSARWRRQGSNSVCRRQSDFEAVARCPAAAREQRERCREKNIGKTMAFRLVELCRFTTHRRSSGFLADGGTGEKSYQDMVRHRFCKGRRIQQLAPQAPIPIGP